MASNRVLIVRIYGIGDYADTNEPLTLTSHGVLGYLPHTTIEGVVTDMTAQLSSEISMFASMGSDPTTSFSVLATAQTLSAIMSRGMTEVRDVDGAVVRTTAYVDANPLLTVNCTDTSTLQVLDTVRIAGTAMLVTNILSGTVFEAQCIFGSVPVPIPMTDLGGELQGAVIYGMRYLNKDYQMGGIEQLPVVISSAEVTATSPAEETVLFRGCVSKVGLNTSAYSANQISVECQSIMGMLLNKPFLPTPNPLKWAFAGMPTSPDQIYDWLGPFTGYRAIVVGKILDGLQGIPFEVNNTAYSTRIGAYQIRKEGEGVIQSIDAVGAFGTGFIVKTTATNGLVDEVTNFLLAFNKGFYATNNGAMAVPIETVRGRSGESYPHTWEELANDVQGEWVGESSFVAQDVQTLIFDLLLGTFNADISGGSGVREANMSAWLPFDWSTYADIIDTGSLNQVFNTTAVREDFPLIQYFDSLTSRVVDGVALPYMHADVKTVGDVLNFILKRLGCFMVYDRGRISFGRWLGNGAWPAEVNDTALANPTISLTFDRTSALQTVEVEVPVPGQGLAETQIRPVNNADRVLTGGAKTMRLGPFMMPTSRYNQVEGTNAFQNACGLIQKYSTAAAIVEVTYRNTVVDLTVGQEIYFSSAFVPNGAGTMGVLYASGIVLKANRAWETPTTAYTFFLPGYLFASNRPSVVSLSAKVVSVTPTGSGDTMVLVEQNEFTNVQPLAAPNAPYTDTMGFAQTIEKNAGNPIPIEVLDQYGTPTGIFALCEKAFIPSNELRCIGTAMLAANQKDIIILHLQTPDLDVDGCWDAFQADTTGGVDSSTALAYPWVR